MILPAFVLVADLAAWWLFGDVTALGEPLLATVCFGLALSFLVWLVIEVYQFREEIRSTGRSSGDYS